MVKKTRSKRPSPGGGAAAGSVDERFRSMHSNPTFETVKPDSRKVKLDKRFSAVLTDERFQVAPAAKVDKYGRKVNKGAAQKAAKNELAAFYKVDDEEDHAEDGVAAVESPEHSDNEIADRDQSGSDNENSESDIEEKEIHKKPKAVKSQGKKNKGKSLQEEPGASVEDRIEYLNKLARGEVMGEGSSSSSENDSDVEGEGSEGGIGVEESEEESDSPEDEDIPMGEETERIAIQNCDWEHMKAVDLFVVSSSFCPPNGAVTRVTVYPSDYGLEMMKEEERYGPISVLKAAKKLKEKSVGTAEKGKIVKRDAPGIVLEPDLSDDEEAGASVGGDVDPEALRIYELHKVKYYFAVVECTSKTVAAAVYKEVDGMEFETSSIALDLRFIPADISFDGREIRDSATKIPSNYVAPSFVFKALQQTKVECSWDTAPDERSHLIAGGSNWKNTNEDDFSAYLASTDDDSSSSSENESEHENMEEGGDSGTQFEENSRKNRVQNSDPDEELSGSEGKSGKNPSKKGVKTGENGQNSRKNKKIEDNYSSEESIQDDIHEQKGGNMHKGRNKKEKAAEMRRKLLAGLGVLSESEEEEEGEGDMEFTFTPKGSGTEELSRKIAERTKKVPQKEETPWEESLRKRKEKKKAKKAAREAAAPSDQEENNSDGDDIDHSEGDDFFENETKPKKTKTKSKKGVAGDEEGEGVGSAAAASAEELGLLVAGDDVAENETNFDMRALLREQKMKNKKLKGKRKRKEEAREKAPGGDFEVDLQDNRFSAVLEGDSRFGIDTTAPEFKETEGMKNILEEQRNRRKRKGQGQEKSQKVRSNDSGFVTQTEHSGDVNLSALVSKFKAHAKDGKRPRI